MGLFGPHGLVFMPMDDADSDSGSSGSSSSSSGKWSDSRTAKGLGAAGSSLMSYGKSQSDKAARMTITPVAYRKGGKVRKTGPAIVHRGERVVPADKRKKVERSMKREGMSLTNRKRKSKGRTGGR